jgi:hypothetical protein
MWLFPKKLFEWKESREFRRAYLLVETARRKWWASRPAFVLYVAVIFLLDLWLTAPNARPFIEVLPIAFVGALIFVYFLWCLKSRFERPCII